MRSHAPVTAYVALGSNVGNRQASINAAIAQLKSTPEIEVTRVSSLLDNPAVGGPADSGPFLNGVAEIATTLGSHALLHRLLEIEKALGRERREKWAPRTIDLDILLYGDRIIASDDLVIPHPLIQERRFVLVPLAELAPELVHPTLQMTIAVLLENLNSRVTSSSHA